MKPFLRKLHRWLGLLMALQILAWMVSGNPFCTPLMPFELSMLCVRSFMMRDNRQTEIEARRILRRSLVLLGAFFLWFCRQQILL